MLGKQVYNQIIENGKIQLSKSNRFSSGIYLIKVLGPNNDVFNKKLLRK